MKRISAMICAFIMAVVLMAPAAFATEKNEGAAAANKSGVTILSSSPENGADGVAVDNLSVKITFSKDMKPKNEDVRKANARQFKLKDSNGKKVPVKVYYSDDEKGLVLVAADTFSDKGKNTKIKGDEQYVLSIGSGLQASDGTTLGSRKTISMKTLNQSRSTLIYMVLMALMMVGMIFFTIRSTKKEEKKKNEAREAKEGVNPYKEAKKSGKSVEQVVAQTSRKKAKKDEAIRKQKEAEAALEAEIIEKIRKESNKRVSAPKSISAAGSSLKLKVAKASVKNVPEETVKKNSKGTTRPKNQSGKNRNKNKKK